MLLRSGVLHRCVPSLPISLLLAFYTFLCYFSFVQADFQDIYIDDQTGDARTGDKPSYHPSDQWSYGPSCTDCLIRPDPSQAQGGSWHDTSVLNNDPYYISLSFVGPSIQVYCIVPNSIPGPPTDIVNMHFTLDGVELPPYQHQPDPTNSLVYHVRVLDHGGLTNSPHTLVVTPQVGSVILFDYAIYQFGSPDSPPPPPPTTSTITVVRTTAASSPVSTPTSQAISQGATSPTTSTTSTTSLPSSPLPSSASSQSSQGAALGTSSHASGLSTSLGSHGTNSSTMSSTSVFTTLSTTTDAAGRTSEVQVTVTSVFSISGATAAATVIDSPLVAATTTKHVPLGLIIGVVAGVVALVVLVAVWLILRRRKYMNKALVAHAWHSENREERSRPSMRPISSSSGTYISTIAISPTDLASEGSMVRLLPSAASACSLPSTDHHEIPVVNEKKSKDGSHNDNSTLSPNLSRASSSLHPVSTRLLSGASSTLHPPSTRFSTETSTPGARGGLSFAEELALRERVDMLHAQVQRIVSSAPHAFDEEQPPTYMQARILPHPPYTSELAS